MSEQPPSSDQSDQTAQQKEKSRFQIKRSIVKIGIPLPGNFGLNNGGYYIEDTHPDRDAPGFHLSIIDGNGPLMESRYTSQKNRKLKNLKAWEESGRLDLIQVKWDPKVAARLEREALAKQTKQKKDKEPESVGEATQEEIKVVAGEVTTDNPRPKYKRFRMYFGAGGVPEAGRVAAEGSAGKFKKFLRGKHFVFMWVGAGGGTGTSVAAVMARLALEMGIPVVVILTTPFSNEGKKIHYANELKDLLLSMGCKVLVMKNPDPPALIKKSPSTPTSEIATSEHEKKEKSGPGPGSIDVYREINLAIRHVFRTTREITQVQGDTSDIDPEDINTATTGGRHWYAGDYIHDLQGWTKNKDHPEDLPIVDVEKVVEKCLSHPYQNHGIVAGGILVVFHGPWAHIYIEQIKTLILEETVPEEKRQDVEIKHQSYEADTTQMWVSVWIFGEFPEPKAESRAEQGKAKTTNGKNRIYNILVEGKPGQTNVPVDLIERWEAELSKSPRDRNMTAIQNMIDEFRIYGPVPDRVLVPQPLRAV